MKIRGKIFVAVMSMAFIFFIIVVGYLGWNFRRLTIKEAKKLTDSFAKQSANLVKAKLDTDMATARTLAEIFSGYEKLSYEVRTPIYEDMMAKIVKKHPKYLSVWTSWELSAIRSNRLKPYGREKTEVLKINGGETQIIHTLENLEGDDIGSLYHKIKISRDSEFILDPYFYTYNSREYKDSILETSLAVHIRTRNDYKGLIGFDLELSELQTIIDMPIPFENSYMFMLSNNGTFVAHPIKSFVGQNMTSFFDKKYSEINFLNRIKNGRKFSVNNLDESGNINAYTSFAPIYVGKSRTPWSVGVTVPIEVITRKSINNFYYTLFVGVLGFIILTVVISVISQNITKPLRRTINVLHKLDTGDISIFNKLQIKRKDEIGEMARSVNTLIETLNTTANFAVKIGKGEFDAELKTMGEHDILGNALLGMRENLRNAQEERSKRIIEVGKRTWFQNGISEISEKIQSTYKDKEELAYTLIKEMVQYLGASQGGFFITERDNENNMFLELTAAYAYGRKRKLSAKVEVGETLVGRCAQERKTIYISDIPDGYTFISSGLGEEKPKELIITPLLHERKVFGIIEIASFKTIEKYQIDFLEIASQRIASVIANMKINEDTSKLLEKFKRQSDKLILKEKETIETISRLKKAQSKILAREVENRATMDAFISVVSIVFYDMEGKITNLNQKNQDIFGIKKEDIIGKTHFELLDEAKENPEKFTKFWDDLRKGKRQEKEYYLKYLDKEIWLSETFIPVLDKYGKPEKVMNIGIDITQRKLLERKLKEITDSSKKK